MAVTWNTANWFTNNGSGTSVTVNAPNNLGGDDYILIVLLVRGFNNADVLDETELPGDLVLVDKVNNYDYVGDDYSGDIYLLAKFSTGSETNRGLTLTDTLQWRYISTSWQGVDQTTPIATGNIGKNAVNNDTSLNIPQITGNLGNTLVSIIGLANNESNVLSTEPTEPSGMTMQLSTLQGTSVHAASAIATQDSPDGTTGSRDWSWVNGQSTCGILFELTAAETNYTLTITSDHGTVTKNPDKAEYEDGETVELTANPDPGWKFDSWTGDVPE